MEKIFPVLTTATIFLSVIITIPQGNSGAQAQKTQDQIWQEQHEGQVMKCLGMGIFKEYEGATGQSTAESDEILETCNHDVLYMLGICEQNNDGYTFCDSVHTYIDDNNLDQISERPEQLSQETIDGINEHDWNEDGVTDGSDFVSKPSITTPVAPTPKPEQSDSTGETPSIPTPPATPENGEGNEDDQSTDEDDNNSSGGNEENLFG